MLPGSRLPNKGIFVFKCLLNEHVLEMVRMMQKPFFMINSRQATLGKAYQCSFKLGLSLKYHRLFK